MFFCLRPIPKLFIKECGLDWNHPVHLLKFVIRKFCQVSVTSVFVTCVFFQRCVSRRLLTELWPAGAHSKVRIVDNLGKTGVTHLFASMQTCWTLFFLFRKFLIKSFRKIVFLEYCQMYSGHPVAVIQCSFKRSHYGEFVKKQPCHVSFVWYFSNELFDLLL